MQDSFSSTDRSFPPLFPSSSLFVQLENELRSQIQIPAKITGRPVAHGVEEPETRACSDWQAAHPLTHPMFWIANINFCPLIGILNPSFSMQQVEKFFYSLVYYAGRIILLLFLRSHKTQGCLRSKPGRNCCCGVLCVGSFGSLCCLKGFTMNFGANRQTICK